jgi:hypothetical protein
MAMTGDLDDLLSGLAQAPADRSLQGLESSVLAGVAGERSARRAVRALAPAQAAAVVAAVVVGVAAGGVAGMSVSRPPPPAMLSTALAPSTLLVASR